MTTRVEEIQGRLAEVQQYGLPLSREGKDIAYLLAEVTRLEDAFGQMHECAGKAMNDWVDERARAEDAESLALSLAEALERLRGAAVPVDREMLDRVEVHPCDSDNDDVKRRGLWEPFKALSVTLVGVDATLSDSRLLKLRGKE